MIVSLLFATSLVLGANAAYLNQLDQPFTFTCPKHSQTVSHVHSIHSNHNEDRQFEIECRDFLQDPGVYGNPSCYWTPNWVNSFDGPLHFTCNAGHYISGMQSEHNNHNEDRRWKFYCCNIANVQLVNCALSGWTNNFDQPQNFILADNKVMSGVVSVHNNHNEDRQYEYEYCGFLETE